MKVMEYEKISKQKAKELFDAGDIDKVEVATFKGLAFIHTYWFGDIYDFAGIIREVNITKGNFRFAPRMYLKASLEHIDTLPQGSFDQIIEKYVEMILPTLSVRVIDVPPASG